MEDVTLKDSIFTHGGSENGFFIGTPGVRDGKAVLIYGRHGHLDYIDIDALSSQVRECLDRYMTRCWGQNHK